jgi:anaerobic selenocysteine-containing dehydrogenase
VLPATTFWERNDVHTPWARAGHYAIYMRQAIQPMYECRNDMAIFGNLAARLGINDYDDRTEEQWLRELTRAPSATSRPSMRTAPRLRMWWLSPLPNRSYCAIIVPPGSVGVARRESRWRPAELKEGSGGE